MLASGPAFERELPEVTRSAVVYRTGGAESHRSHEICDFAAGMWYRIGAHERLRNPATATRQGRAFTTDGRGERTWPPLNLPHRLSAFGAVKHQVDAGRYELEVRRRQTVVDGR